MRRLIAIFNWVLLLLLDMLLGVGIWVVLAVVLVGVFPGEPNPDGSTSRWWWILVALAVAIIVTFFRRRRRRKSNLSSEETQTEYELSTPSRSNTQSGSAASPRFNEAKGPSLPRKSERRPRNEPVEQTKPTVRIRNRAWVPVRESVTVKGRKLSEGMVYVGSGLRGVSQHIPIEPALIDPSLPVDNRHPDIDGEYMGYWPSYSDVSPKSRAAYLDWLAAGRPAGAYVGYVFLFFYGIERRILYETDRSELAGAESAALVEEVERLQDLYRNNNSFNGYASEFLSIVNCLRTDTDLTTIQPPLVRRGWELPIEVKLGLGSIVASGEPLPASWALSWLRLHPETSLRTPAVRCEDEFNALFRVRYREVLGAGMRIQRNKTPLKHSYQPASSSFRSHVAISADGLPDVSKLKRPVRQLWEIAETVTNELDPYSRWVGRHQDRESLGAVALLPKELVRERQSEELQRFKRKIESGLAGNDLATIPVGELIEGFPTKRPGTFSAKEASTFAQLLERLGIGVTPDIRYSNVNLTNHQHTAVFRLDAEETEPSEGYQAATVLIQLGAAVSAADGTISVDEERVLESHLEESLGLSQADRTRLRAYLMWLLIEPPTLNRMKSRMRAMSQSELKQLARFAITIAGADGSVSSVEIKVLNRVYNLLGLDVDQLHRDIHELASAPPTQPVTVLRPDETSSHRIPPPPSTPDDRVALDREKIAEIMKNTREVTDLLTKIFEGPLDPEPPEEDIEDAEADVESATASDIAGGLLDPAHAELVRFLSTRPNWPRSEFEKASNKLGLMPAGAIETINDAAFERCDEPLIEGEDQLDMNEAALQELLGAS